MDCNNVFEWKGGIIKPKIKIRWSWVNTYRTSYPDKYLWYYSGMIQTSYMSRYNKNPNPNSSG